MSDERQKPPTGTIRPVSPVVLAVLGIVGLVLSLAVRPRRTWVRARRVGSRTVVEVAALDRVPRDDLGTRLEDLLAQLRSGLGDPPDDPEKEPR